MKHEFWSKPNLHKRLTLSWNPIIQNLWACSWKGAEALGLQSGIILKKMIFFFEIYTPFPPYLFQKCRKFSVTELRRFKSSFSISLGLIYKNRDLKFFSENPDFFSQKTCSKKLSWLNIVCLLHIAVLPMSLIDKNWNYFIFRWKILK